MDQTPDSTIFEIKLAWSAADNDYIFITNIESKTIKIIANNNKKQSSCFIAIEKRQLHQQVHEKQLEFNEKYMT